MRERRRGMYELEPVVQERERAEERRRKRQRLHRGARVVHEARQGQLGRAAATADRLGALEHEDLATRLREDDGRGEPVRPGPDDDRGLRQVARIAALCQTLRHLGCYGSAASSS